MRKPTRTAAISVALSLAFLIGAGAIPEAAAKGPSINATGGDGTAVDRDGTQGSYSDAVQGVEDTDGDQDAFMTGSEEARPQFTAPHKH